jgi:hypothetical protein
MFHSVGGKQCGFHPGNWGKPMILRLHDPTISVALRAVCSIMGRWWSIAVWRRFEAMITA